jgi:hypothetical protein
MSDESLRFHCYADFHRTYFVYLNSARPSLAHTSDQARAVRGHHLARLRVDTIWRLRYDLLLHQRVAIEIGCPDNLLDKNVAAVGGAAIPLQSQNWISSIRLRRNYICKRADVGLQHRPVLLAHASAQIWLRPRLSRFLMASNPRPPAVGQRVWTLLAGPSDSALQWAAWIYLLALRRIARRRYMPRRLPRRTPQAESQTTSYS